MDLFFFLYVWYMHKLITHKGENEIASSHISPIDVNQHSSVHKNVIK